MFYHTWDATLSSRNLNVDELTWDGNVPVLRGPGRTIQPVPQRPNVVGRYAFYNDSVFDGGSPASGYADDGAAATDKIALLPSGAATFANVTSYDKGLNGIFLDVAWLPRDYVPSVADFAFRTGSAPGAPGMTTAPAATSITVRRGAGVNGSDRVAFAWSGSAVRNGFLQVTMFANSHTALAAPDVFSFGNVTGETGDEPDGWAVTSADYLRTRAALGSAGLVPLTSPFDFNRDGRVNARDLAIVRASQPRPAAAQSVPGATSVALAPRKRTLSRRRDLWAELGAS
jgi:hypothetical protein